MSLTPQLAGATLLYLWHLSAAHTCVPQEMEPVETAEAEGVATGQQTDVVDEPVETAQVAHLGDGTELSVR